VCVYAHAHACVITIDLGWKSISVVTAVFSQITLYVNVFTGVNFLTYMSLCVLAQCPLYMCLICQII